MTWTDSYKLVCGSLCFSSPQLFESMECAISFILIILFCLSDIYRMIKFVLSWIYQKLTGILLAIKSCFGRVKVAVLNIRPFRQRRERHPSRVSDDQKFSNIRHSKEGTSRNTQDDVKVSKKGSKAEGRPNDSGNGRHEVAHTHRNSEDNDKNWSESDEVITTSQKRTEKLLQDQNSTVINNSRCDHSKTSGQGKRNKSQDTRSSQEQQRCVSRDDKLESKENKSQEKDDHKSVSNLTSKKSDTKRNGSKSSSRDIAEVQNSPAGAKKDSNGNNSAWDTEIAPSEWDASNGDNGRNVIANNANKNNGWDSSNANDSDWNAPSTEASDWTEGSDGNASEPDETTWADDSAAHISGNVDQSWNNNVQGWSDPETTTDCNQSTDWHAGLAQSQSAELVDEGVKTRSSTGRWTDSTDIQHGQKRKKDRKKGEDNASITTQERVRSGRDIKGDTMTAKSSQREESTSIDMPKDAASTENVKAKKTIARNAKQKDRNDATFESSTKSRTERPTNNQDWIPETSASEGNAEHSWQTNDRDQDNDAVSLTWETNENGPKITEITDEDTEQETANAENSKTTSQRSKGKSKVTKIDEKSRRVTFDLEVTVDDPRSSSLSSEKKLPSIPSLTPQRQSSLKRSSGTNNNDNLTEEQLIKSEQDLAKCRATIRNLEDELIDVRADVLSYKATIAKSEADLAQVRAELIIARDELATTKSKASDKVEWSRYSVDWNIDDHSGTPRIGRLSDVWPGLEQDSVVLDECIRYMDKIPHIDQETVGKLKGVMIRLKVLARILRRNDEHDVK